jgi:hypothetical protein
MNFMPSPSTGNRDVSLRGAPAAKQARAAPEAPEIASLRSQ